MNKLDLFEKIKYRFYIHATDSKSLRKEILTNVGLAAAISLALIIGNNIISTIFPFYYLYVIVDVITFCLILYAIYVVIAFPIQFKQKVNVQNIKTSEDFKKSLGKQLVLRYLGHLTIAAILSFVFFILFLNIYGFLELRNYGIIYDLLSILFEYFPLIVIIYLIVVLFIITFYDFLKPLSYIDSMYAVIEQMSTDLNSEIHLESDLAPLQDKLNALRLTSLRNQISAKENEKRKDELVTYLAHDLKTPLTSVIGYLSLLDLEKDISDTTRDHYIDVALDKAYRVEELINELFEITHFNITQMELTTTTSDIYRLIDQTVFEFQPMLSKRHLTFKFSHKDDSCLIAMDCDKMARVFDNLIKNAIHYAYENTTITLDATINDNYVEFIMNNQAATIHPDKLDRLFEPFYRADTSRTSATGGSGLGLAIVKEIVTMHRGSIRVASANETITFYLSLPLS